jgi:hypothetical protein
MLMQEEMKGTTNGSISSTQTLTESRTGTASETAAGKELPPSLNGISGLGQTGRRVVKRRIAYYSDFEVDLNDWKSEDERIQIYSETLRKGLSMSDQTHRSVDEGWQNELKSVLYELVDESGGVRPSKTMWDVAVEYVLLTRESTKVALSDDACRNPRKESRRWAYCTHTTALKSVTQTFLPRL